MAGCSHGTLLTILFVVLLATTAAGSTIPSCPVPCECEINLSFYMHQVVVGPTHNQEVMVNSPYPQGFGTIAVHDWTIIEAPEPNAAVLGHARGIHVQADQANRGWYTSLTVVFENASRFKGSTFQVMGISAAQGQLAIVGGTGEFATARGTMNYNITKGTKDVESYKLIDIHAYYIRQAGYAAGSTIL